MSTNIPKSAPRKRSKASPQKASENETEIPEHVEKSYQAGYAKFVEINNAINETDFDKSSYLCGVAHGMGAALGAGVPLGQKTVDAQMVFALLRCMQDGIAGELANRAKLLATEQ